MNKTRVPKCSAGGFCSTLLERFSDNKRGLTSVTTINLKTGESKTIGVRYCLNAKDNGLMLNFCPWCGEDIQFFREGR
jgi:hypothetical protein